MEIEQGKLPPPPGLVSSVARGFDAVASHFLVILPPLLLDLFLWLGPRWRLTTFIQSLLDLSQGYLPASVSAADVEATQKVWQQIAADFNLFAALRTFPVGTPSLLAIQMPRQNPLGTPSAFESVTLPGFLGWTFVLVLAGWLVGALYYYWVAGISIQVENRSLGKSLVHTLILSVFWMILLVLVGFPAFTLIGALSLASQEIAQVVMFFGAMTLTWLVMPVFFSAHGIFTFQLDALRSILNSLRMVRFTLPNIALFLLAFVVINQGLNFLWTTPAQDSWWLLVGIGGHAFVSTALLAASFIYYRDINGWLKVVFEQLQKQTTTIAKA